MKILRLRSRFVSTYQGSDSASSVRLEVVVNGLLKNRVKMRKTVSRSSEQRGESVKRRRPFEVFLK